jgi:tRNA G18 (ribose-2'-O)-methylase SpoU
VPTIRIDDISDSRLDAYRNVRDADLIRDRGSFMIEGRYILGALLRGARYPVRSLLLNEPAHERLTEVLGQLPDDIPVYIAPQPVMDGVVGFHIHRGCLAEGVRTDPPSLDELIGLAHNRPIVLIEDLTNHDNVGGIFRAALALKAGGVIITDRTADPLYRKAIRVSMGATLQLPWTTAPTITDAIDALRNRGYRTIALTPDESAIDLRALGDDPALADRPPIAVLLGTEGEGLTRRALESADLTVRIDIDARADSLNVTTAATVALYELTRM